ncbi:MAG TPA: DUF2480 family protein [Lunatimonas sp.]|nr:DUF2480 family protein [Lunatimonas sp.]
MSEIVNRVANSAIVSLDLETYFQEGQRKSFDLRPYLFQEMIVREKEFRQMLRETDWEEFRDALVSVYCSADAIIPTWAYMLVMTYLEGVVKEAVIGDPEDLEKYVMTKALQRINPKDFEGRPVVVKGCGKLPVPIHAYGEIVRILKGSARSIMYGEPCSTVPVYKAPRVGN